MPSARKARKRKAIAAGRQRRQRVAVPDRCFFCAKGIEPSALEFEILRPFLTRRGKIRGQRRSGLCRKHQHRLAKEIKRARNLGLLPFKIEG